MASLSVVFDLIAKDKASSAIRNVGSAADDTAKKMGGLSSKGVAVGSAIGGLAAGGISAGLGAIKNFAGGAVDAFARVEDATGAAGVQFGKQLPSIVKFADEAGKNFGISKGAALDAANTFGTMGKAAGLQGPQLAGFANQFSGLAGDLASFKGTSTEQAIEAIGSALRGEAEPIRAYGVLLDDASLRQEALSQGLIKTTKEALTPQQKVLAAQALILKQTTDAQGDYQRTSDSTANTQKTLSAEIENAQAKLGEKMAPALTKVREGFLKMIEGSSSAIDAIGRLSDKVQPFINTMVENFGPAVKASFGLMADALGAIPTSVLVAIAAAVGAVGVALGISAAATAIQTAAMGALNAVMLLNPFVAVAALIIGLGAALIYAYKTSDSFREKVDKAFAIVKGAGQALAKFVTDTIPAAFNAVKDKASAAMDRMKDVVSNAWTAIKTAIPAAWNAIKDTFVAAVTTLADYIKGRPAQFVENVQLIWTAIKNAVSGAWNLIRDALATAFGVLIEYIKGRPQQFVDNMQLIWTAVKNAIPAAFGLIRDKIGAAFTGKGGILDKVKGFGGDVVDAIVDGIKGAGSLIESTVKGLLNKLPGIDFKIGGNQGDGPGRPVTGGNTLKRVQGLVSSMGGSISSTYRTPARNRAVGGSPTSYHMDRNNPAVDIVGSTATLDAIHARLRAIGGWRELLWRVPNHAPGDNPHIHVAHAGGTVASDWATMPGLRRDERPVITQVGETILAAGDSKRLVNQNDQLIGLLVEVVRYSRDTRDMLESQRRFVQVGG